MLDKLFSGRTINITLWCLFIAFTLFVAVRGNPNVAKWYVQGAQYWLHGIDLYNTSTIPVNGSHSVAGTGFIYFPQAAIMYVPFSLLPPCLSRIVWRLVLIALMLIMLRKLQGTIKQQTNYSNVALLSAVMIFPGISSAITGQMNIVLLALTLFGAMSIARQQWRQASFWLVFALAAKPTAIVILLLAAGSYKKLWKPLFFSLVIILLLPFFFQHTDYVIAQYKGIVSMLTAANNIGISSSRWSQIFGMLTQITGINANYNIQTIIRLVAALVTLALMRYIVKHNDRQGAFFLFTLSSLYLMLFNPRTEANDYVQLAPVFMILLTCIPQKYTKSGTALLLVLVAAMAFNGDISKLLIPGSHNWLAPLATVILCLYLAWLKFRSQIQHSRIIQAVPYL